MILFDNLSDTTAPTNTYGGGSKLLIFSRLIKKFIFHTLPKSNGKYTFFYVILLMFK